MLKDYHLKCLSEVKMKKIVFVFSIFISFQFFAQSNLIHPVNTFSIVARDSITGEMGVAVQSHWFSVGTVVSWAEAGVGVVATQSFAEISYGYLGLQLMKAGKSANEALDALLSIDPTPEVRQVAMIDKFGNVAVHTGNKCIYAAGHKTGKQYSVQANMMENETVWEEMSNAYENTKGDLLDKLMAALESAQNAGGDIRGMQSAAILIVPGETQGAPWKEKIVDLRIDDHPNPIEEMKRLIQVHRAYQHMNKGDEYLASNEIDKALIEYEKASQYYPENVEIFYWVGVTLASTGKVDESLKYFKKAFDKDKKWIELTKRLPEVGLLPIDEEMMKKIISSAD